jgi:Ser/Thr protein kinase RdoA (MazF antagonist)
VLWRLDTDRGRFAVKELLVPSEHDTDREVALVSEMRRRGVAAPEPVPTPYGEILARVGPAVVRVFTWVELEAPRTDLDPDELGTLLATLHRNPMPAGSPVDGWYTDPVPLAV